MDNMGFYVSHDFTLWNIYCHNLSKSEIREMYVLAAHWFEGVEFWTTTTIRYLKSKFEYPNRWAANDIRIRFIACEKWQKYWKL